MHSRRLYACLCFLTSVYAAETFDKITKTVPRPGTEDIRIDHPNPTKRATEYFTVTFRPGDLITISAGGCVQSGGSGSTWHRYVNPSGGDADRLYHGLITVPFATGALERIQKYQNRQVKVSPTAPPGNLHLQLGFEDDNYSDNGYWGHDDGPNDQCKGPNGGPAWVHLVIVHGSGVTPPPPGNGDWDVLFTQFDDNGIPLNPNWRTNTAAQNPHVPDPATCRWPWQNPSQTKACTNQITDTDTYSLCQAFSENFGFGGHANWIASTFTGTVKWEEKSIPTQDDEYSVNLTTPGAAGATAGRREGVHVEFDSDETIDVLTDDFKLPWWQGFRKAVDDGDSQAHAYLDNKFMIVTGLMGVDFAHTPGGESHPAWSVAIRANDDPTDETWAMFVRGWGNEGYCSGNQHLIGYIDNQFTFRLQWPPGARSGSVKSSNFWTNGQNVGAMTVSFIQGQAVQVTFHDLPDPSTQSLIGGELHLSWVGASPPPLRRTVPITGIRPVVVADATEAYVGSMVARLTPPQRAIYLANHKPPTRVKKPAVTLRVQTTPAVVKANPTRRPQIRTAPDAALVAAKNNQIDALKKAFGGALPPRK